MDINIINKSIISDFITKRKFSIFRHTILCVCVILLTLNVRFSGEYMNEYAHYFEYIVLFLLFAGMIYLNRYVIVPRLLLKNKLSGYIKTLLIIVSIIVAILCIIQFAFHHIDWNEHNNYEDIIFSLINTYISIAIIIFCTTSFALFKDWLINSQRLTELTKNTLALELQYLKNQINPHFLFNMLNNVNIMIRQNPLIASNMLIELDNLLSYQTENSIKEEVLLINDIQFLTSYLELEKSRRSRFNYEIQFNRENLEEIKVPPLLFIPFVENAVKHSYDRGNISTIRIIFRKKNKHLIFICENSKPQKLHEIEKGGLGLENIKKRLNLLYGNSNMLEIKNEMNYTVNLKLKL